MAGRGWRLSQRGRSCAHPAPVAACFCKKGCGRVTGPPQALALVLSPAKVLFLSALHCVLCDCELCNCALSDSALCYCVLLCNCAPCYSAPCYCATATVCSATVCSATVRASLFWGTLELLEGWVYTVTWTFFYVSLEAVGV